MGCLFGYHGPDDPLLLERMAAFLSHRCHSGWESVSYHHDNGHTSALGHGIAPWSQASQIALGHDAALAHAGLLRDVPPVAQLLPQLIQQPAALEALDGAFVLALADAAGLHLLRDAAGVKALYWTLAGERLLFASEIKALLADPTVERQLRPGAVADYLSYSFVPGASTMLNGIFELQPGTRLDFQQGHVRERRFFQIETLEPSITRPPPADPVAAFRALLFQETAAYLQHGEHHPGVFLSGGVDSSSVLAVASRLTPRPLATFSIHFGKEYAHENDFIQQMVTHCRSDHHSVEVRPQDVVEQFEEIVWRLDEPIGDPVTVPNYLLAQMACQHTPVILNGEGGDPCLGGPKNTPMLLARLYGPGPNDTPDTYLERAYLHSFQRGFRDLSRLLTPDLYTQSGGEAALIATLQPYFQSPLPVDFLNRLMSINMRLKGANLILVKVEKMTSAHGVLALPPLFTRAVMAASMACPPELKLHGTTEKVLLKAAMDDLLPSTIIDRPKSGMMVPVQYWFQQRPLKNFARHHLHPRVIRRHGLFNTEYVKKLLSYDQDAVPGARHGLKLWMLLTLTLWYERYVDGPRPVPGPPPRRVRELRRQKAGVADAEDAASLNRVDSDRG